MNRRQSAGRIYENRGEADLDVRSGAIVPILMLSASNFVIIGIITKDESFEGVPIGELLRLHMYLEALA